MLGQSYMRADGKWVTPVNLPSDKNGKRNRKVFYGKTENESRKKAKNFIDDYKLGNIIEYSTDTLVQFLNEYLEANSNIWQKTTYELYKTYVDVHIAPYFKTNKLKDIKPMTLDKFYAYKLENYRTITQTQLGKSHKRTIPPISINTVHKLNTFFKAAFNYAIKNDMLVKNPATKTTLPKKEKFKPNVYDTEKFKQLLKHVSGTDDEIPIILGAGVGLRRSELFALTWKDIDFTNKTININKAEVVYSESVTKAPKNETSIRIVNAPAYVINTLEKYKPKNAKPTDIIITRWLQKSYSEHFRKLLEKYDLEKIRFHDLRHYNAVAMMLKGIPDKVAAERLGHSEVVTLRNVYQHVIVEMDQLAADKLNDIFE